MSRPNQIFIVLLSVNHLGGCLQTTITLPTTMFYAIVVCSSDMYFKDLLVSCISISPSRTESPRP